MPLQIFIHNEKVDNCCATKNTLVDTIVEKINMGGQIQYLQLTEQNRWVGKKKVVVYCIYGKDS